MRIDSLPPSPLNLPFAILGMSNTGWQGGPLPRLLNFMGLPGCRQYVSADVAGPLLNLGGTATWDLPVPENPALIGMRFYVQALVLEDGINPAGAIVSNGGEAIVGLRPRVTGPGSASPQTAPTIK